MHVAARNNVVLALTMNCVVESGLFTTLLLMPPLLLLLVEVVSFGEDEDDEFDCMWEDT